MTQKSYRAFVALTAAALLILLFGEAYHHGLTSQPRTNKSSVRSRWYQHPFKSDAVVSASSTPFLPPNEASLRTLLRPHIEDEPFRYARKRIIVRQGKHSDDISLPPENSVFAPQWVDSTDLPQTRRDAESYRSEDDQLLLALPTPSLPPHTPHICFGLATDVDRLRNNLPHMRHWMTNPGISVLVMAPQHDEATQLQKEWRELGIDITVQQTAMPFFDRLLSLIPAMRKLDATTKTANQYSTEWFIILDDDTFVPSVPRLASTLAAYDHTKPFWIGGLGESRSDLSNIGMFPYGGAGMVFSPALVADLASWVPDCIKKGTQDWGGDMRVAECVERYTRVRMTYVRDLHQIDLVGDQSGLYESGFKPATLHHWGGWAGGAASVPMDRVARVAQITGDEGLFQRWRFADGWVLSNGFSMVHYPSLEGQQARLQSRQVRGPLEQNEWEGDLGSGRTRGGLDRHNTDTNNGDPHDDSRSGNTPPNGATNGIMTGRPVAGPGRQANVEGNSNNDGAWNNHNDMNRNGDRKAGAGAKGTEGQGETGGNMESQDRGAAGKQKGDVVDNGWKKGHDRGKEHDQNVRNGEGEELVNYTGAKPGDEASSDSGNVGEPGHPPNPRPNDDNGNRNGNGNGNGGSGQGNGGPGKGNGGRRPGEHNREKGNGGNGQRNGDNGNANENTRRPPPTTGLKQVHNEEQGNREGQGERQPQDGQGQGRRPSEDSHPGARPEEGRPHEGTPNNPRPGPDNAPPNPPSKGPPDEPGPPQAKQNSQSGQDGAGKPHVAANQPAKPKSDPKPKLASPNNPVPKPPSPPPEARKRIDFSLTEFTWDGRAVDFGHTLGPFRPKLPPEEKRSWLFIDSVTIGEDEDRVNVTSIGEAQDPIVRQLYLKKTETDGMAEVIELVWSR